MIVYDYLLKTRNLKGAGFLVLIDPDRVDPDHLVPFVEQSVEAGVDAFLVGTSLLTDANASEIITTIKKTSEIPAIIFPGSWRQIAPEADAILYLSLISGRNPDYLISEQVKGAPAVKACGIEAIPTGYMLIDSGKRTSVEFMSSTLPIPRDKSDIAKVHALAGEYLGMKLIYLEAGSGAIESVPDKMVEEVTNYITCPVIVGGGIDSPEEAHSKVISGAPFVVVGNHFEKGSSRELLSQFAEAVHVRSSAGVEL